MGTAAVRAHTPTTLRSDEGEMEATAAVVAVRRCRLVVPVTARDDAPTIRQV